MALFNYATKEITLKVVYYGPGLSGKTTNLQHLYEILDPSTKGKFISLATEADRTLFFDFLPVDLGKIKDFTMRFQLYTVPGQIRYNATRKLVLKGADAIIFVADSQREMREQNIESLKNMRENLVANNINPDDIPVVMQYNKRDLQNILSIDELEHDLNNKNYTYTEAAAFKGTGVKETFDVITKEVLKDISRKHKVDVASPKVDVAPLTVDVAPPKKEGISVKLPEKEAFDIKEVMAEQAGFEETAAVVEPVKPRIEPEKLPEKPRLEPKPMRPPLPGPEAVRPEPFKAQAVARPPISEEKLDAIINSLNQISASLKAIQDAMPPNIIEAMRAVSQEIRQEIKDSQKQQTEILKTLSAIKEIFGELKTKKSWFGF